MNRKLSVLWQGGITRAGLMVPVAMVGVALPLDFIAKIDGYLIYLRATELLAVYAWGWVLYGLLGLVLAAVMIVPTIVVAKLIGWSALDWTRRVSSWLSLSIILIAFLISMKLWLDVIGIAIPNEFTRLRWLVILALLGSAIWIWRRSEPPNSLSHLALLGSVVGFIVAAVSPLFILSTTAMATAPVAVAKEGETTIERPNIILLTIDALSANHVSTYGYVRPTTPNLEALAHHANVFERFYANSNFTTPAVASILNGVRPWTHRALQLKARVDGEVAQHGLVARLKNAGYHTIAVATNPWASPFNNRSAQWFDKIAYGRVHVIAEGYFFLRFPLPYIASAFELRFVAHLLAVADRLFLDASADHFDPELAFLAARQFVKNRDPAPPMFLWVHLFPPHDPYATPAPFVGRFDPGLHSRTRFDSTSPFNFLARADEAFPGRYVGRYDESIAYVDHHVGQFIDWIRRQGLYDNTLLVVSADHGESFAKGYGIHSGPMMHDALIRIPLIIKEPSQQASKRLDVLAEQIDLMPTILDLAGIPIGESVEGRSLKPAILGEKVDGAVFSMNFEQSRRFGELHTGSVAMIEGRWKYVHYRGKAKYPLMPKLEDSLYDLQADPEENTDLIAAHPAMATKMLAVIQEQLRRHGSPMK